MFSIGSLFKDILPKGAMASNVAIVRIISNTTTEGAILDLDGHARVLFTIFTGTVTDGDYEWQLFEGDESDMSDEAEVESTDARINGSTDAVGSSVTAIPNWTDDDDDDKVMTFEFTPTKRYCRLKCVSTNTSSGAYLGAIAGLGQPRHRPVQD